MRKLVWFTWVLCAALSFGQQITPEQKAKIDAAIPKTAPAKPQKPRKLLITNLSKRNGQLWAGSSASFIPIHNYAFEQMGKVTGAYEAVLSNDLEMLKPENIKQFDAICFLNTVGVITDDPVIRQSILDFIKSGKGFVGIHDAMATFVQYPNYDQFPEFGRMLGGTENGGHPWNMEEMTLKNEDPNNPVNAAFGGKEFQIVDQAFQLQEPAFRDRLHVLYSVDVEKTPPSPRGRILKQRAEDKDFPMAWLKPYGQGRVFYSALGHTGDTFTNPQMMQHFLAGIQYAFGDLKADDSVKSAE